MPPTGHNHTAQGTGGNGKTPRHYSITMRLRKRRERVRGLRGLKPVAMVAIIILAVLMIGGGGVFSGYAVTYYNQHADAIRALAVNRALETTRIYSRDGVLLYQTFGQNQGSTIYITYCQLPEVIKHATVDTEDATFWSNIGVDFNRIGAAVITDIGSHKFDLGASTITQQLVKLGVLGNSSKTLDRKLNEAILAVGVTQNYTKQQILDMYLNTIFYSNENYGIEAAAQDYFRLDPKDIKINPATKTIDPADTDPTDIAYVNQQRSLGCIPNGATSVHRAAAWLLKPWQATLLAGIPQSPSYYDPITNADNALSRQQDVIGRLLAVGDSQYLCDDPVARTGCHTAAEIGAMTKAALEPASGKDADKLIYPGRFVNQTGQITTRAPYFVEYVKDELATMVPDFASKGWNVYTTLDYGDPTLTDAQLSNVDPTTGQVIDPITKKPLPNHVGLQQYAEWVVKHYIQESYTDYWYGFCPNGISCISKYNVLPAAQNPYANQNAVLKVALNNKQQNVNDGALVAIDPRNGDILAMVGGVDFNNPDKKVGGQNNITTSMSRSMGSSFKPVVYATAFQMGWYPGMIIHDQPVCFPADGVTAGTQTQNDFTLCPGNYIGHNFDYSNYAGAIPITYELGNSLNIPAEQAIEFVGARFRPASPLIPMAQRMGITSLDPRSLGPATALGAQPVPLVELTEAYGTLANNGYHVPRRSMLSVTDALGRTIMKVDSTGKQVPLVDPNPKPGGQAISPQAAYEVTSILIDNNARVSDFGQDNPLHFWNRDMAAKTGTSQDTKDIVTMGYTPWMSLGVWAGNADGTPMGNVIGISGAGYIFHDVMTFAIAHFNFPGTSPTRFAKPQPSGYFPVPSGMHRAVVNCYTGLAPWQGQANNLQCNPTAAPVPLYLSPEFDFQSQFTQNANKQSDINPNTHWTCRGWGCYDAHNGFGTKDPLGEQDITWMINGLDPQSS